MRPLTFHVQELVQPHFLRRDKVTVFGMGGKGGGGLEGEKSSGGGGGGGSSSSSSSSSSSITAQPAERVQALQLTATKREWTVRHTRLPQSIIVTLAHALHSQ